MWHVFPVPGVLEIPLKGSRGEPVDFTRTIASHGVAELPPNELSLEERTLVTTLPVGGGARTVRLTSADRNCVSRWSPAVLELAPARRSAQPSRTCSAWTRICRRSTSSSPTIPGSTGAHQAPEECCARRLSSKTW
jgi:hypothetical protein